jgi:hypothetical protein
VTTISNALTGGTIATVRDMREHGISDTTIAIWIQEIRAAAITEERLRLEQVLRTHPPQQPTHIEIREAIVELHGERK